MARNRTRSTDGRKRKAARSAPSMPGLRWVPVPLGGSHGGNRLAGLRLRDGPARTGRRSRRPGARWPGAHREPGGVDGRRHVQPLGKVPTPTSSRCQPAKCQGCRPWAKSGSAVEIYLRDISSSPQRYGLAEFRLLGTGNQSWPPLDNAATRGADAVSRARSGLPGRPSTLYFDVPASQHGALRLEWEHSGHMMTIPVHVIGKEVGVMVGMCSRRHHARTSQPIGIRADRHRKRKISKSREETLYVSFDQPHPTSIPMARCANAGARAERRRGRLPVPGQ